MRDFAEKSLERKGFTDVFITKDIDGKKFINPQVRQNIYLIFKEAITNVLKHSDGMHVRILFAQNGDTLVLRVHDNGKAEIINNSGGLGIDNIIDPLLLNVE